MYYISSMHCDNLYNPSSQKTFNPMNLNPAMRNDEINGIIFVIANVIILRQCYLVNLIILSLMYSSRIYSYHHQRIDAPPARPMCYLGNSQHRFCYIHIVSFLCIAHKIHSLYSLPRIDSPLSSHFHP